MFPFQISVFIFSGYTLRSEIAGSHGISGFIFLRNLHTVFPPTLQDGSLFSTSSPTFVICSLFDDGHSDRCAGDIVTSIYVFLIISDVTHIYMCLFAICMSSLGEKKPKLSIKVFFPFF